MIIAEGVGRKRGVSGVDGSRIVFKKNIPDEALTSLTT